MKLAKMRITLQKNAGESQHVQQAVLYTVPDHVKDQRQVKSRNACSVAVVHDGAVQRAKAHRIRVESKFPQQVLGVADGHKTTFIRRDG